jgi:hypothetical protein
MDILDEYLEAYRKQKSIEAELAAVKQETNALKEQIVAHFTVNNFDTIKRGDSSINVSWRSFGKVTDYQMLLGWVDNQGEPRSEYLEEVFIKGSPKNPKGIFGMVHDAQIEALKTGSTVQECLPPGLEISTVPVVTVRTYNGSSKERPKSALDKLDDMPF